MPRRATKKRNQANLYRDQIRTSKTQDLPPRSDIPMVCWIRRYHPLICDYLLAHLEGVRELRAWRVAYSALHMLLGGVYCQQDPQREGGPDDAVWSSFDPIRFAEVELPFVLLFSGLPQDFSPHAFEPHFQGFLRFLATRGVVTRDHAESLVVLLHHGLWSELEMGAA